MKEIPSAEKRSEKRLSAGIIVMIYAVVGGLWIAASDSIVHMMSRGPEIITHLQTYKGWFYVGSTAVMLYWLIRRYGDELRESEEKFKAIFDNASDGILLADEENKRFFDGNKIICRMLGYSLEEVRRLGVSDIHPEKDLPYVADQFERQLRGEFMLAGDIPMKRKDGSLFYADINSTPIILSGKRYLMGFFRDVTERKKAEEALRESEQCLRAIIDNASGIVWVKDLDGRFLIINRYIESVLGLPPEKVVGRTVFDLFPQAEADEFTSNDRKVIDSGNSVECEETALLKDRTHAYLSVKFPLRDSRGRIYALGSICTDITDLKRTEAALRDSERNYRTLVDNALVGVYRSTLDGKFLYVNEALARMVGFKSPEELLSEGAMMRYKDPTDREAFIEKLKREKKIGNYEVIAPTKTGGQINALISTTLHGDTISGMVLDITGHKKLEEQLRQAQKIEAIGLLAGGVAHDFNNILSAIIGYANLIQMKLKEDDPIRSNIEQILEAAERAATLTHSLLAFSRKQVMNLRPLNVNEIIRRVERFLVRLIGEDIEIRIALEKGALNVIADSGQLEQVLMNLATNARDAMPEGGRLTISTDRMEIDEGFIKGHGFGAPGQYAVISVTDTGSGMDEETRAKIFEPFFTTKESGKGTGLGLSMVYGIVKQHNGFINVYSEPGRGTTFRSYIPLVSETAREDEKEQAAPAPPARGIETILVAEDDAALRKLSEVVLSEFGYTVILAADGEEAVKRFRENVDRIDLLILDMIMPKKNGREAYEEIKEISPEIKTLFVSGYTAGTYQTKELLDSGLSLLLKPVSPKDLLRKVREVLDEE